MNVPAMRLGRLQQAFLYATATLLLLSGALWLLFHHFVTQQGEFGEMPHVLEPWWLAIHGLAAAALLIGIGSVLPGHVRRAWSSRRNRVSGSVFVTLLLLLGFSGYLLYYTSHEQFRALLSVTHWTLGLGGPAIMTWHVQCGRALRKFRSDPAPNHLSPIIVVHPIAESSATLTKSSLSAESGSRRSPIR